MAFTDFNLGEWFSFDLEADLDLAHQDNKAQDPFLTSGSEDTFYPAKVDFTDALLNQALEDGPPSGWLNTDDVPSLEKSPWHGSDSGMSTASDTGSVPEGSNGPSYEQTSPLPGEVWPEPEGENEFETYLLGNDVSLFENELNRPTGDYVEQNTGEKFVNATTNEPIRKKGKDVNNYESDCSSSGNQSPVRQHKSSSKALNYFQDFVNPSSKSKPSVKIVKVLKATAESDCCEEDIAKALGDQSRKNAIQAKLNREKKKKYVNGLENNVQRLTEENKELKDKNAELQEDITGLREEVQYLKSVLVNASALSGLLRNIGSVDEVKLSASIVGRKRGASSGEEDHSYTAGAGHGPRADRNVKRARMVRDNLEKAGVCLHVNGTEASLEFCARCSSFARRSQAHVEAPK